MRTCPDQRNPVRVGVVVPARNEERHVGVLVESILAQDHKDIAVVVLNDGSTDRTGEILAGFDDPRLTVIDGGRHRSLMDGSVRPGRARGSEGSAGQRCPAAMAALRRCGCPLHPHALSATLGHATRNELGMVSGLGRLVMETFWEKVLQPVVAGLIMAGNDLERVNDPENDDDRPLANGQFILVREDAYRAVDGHAAVKTDVLDDVGMASAIKGAGYPYNLIFMRDLFSCRMYTNLSELWEGWTKNMYAGMRYSLVNLAVVMLFVTWMSLVPYLLLAWGLYSGSAEWTAWEEASRPSFSSCGSGSISRSGRTRSTGRLSRSRWSCSSCCWPTRVSGRSGGRRHGRAARSPSSSTRIRTTWAATRRRYSGRGTQN